MLEKRSFSLSGHRTSVALEPEFWTALETIASRQGRPLAALIARVDSTRTPADPLASRLRVLALTDALTLRKDFPGMVPGG